MILIKLNGERLVPLNTLLNAMEEGRVEIEIVPEDVPRHAQMHGRLGATHVLSALIDQIRVRDNMILELEKKLYIATM